MSARYLGAIGVSAVAWWFPPADNVGHRTWQVMLVDPFMLSLNGDGAFVQAVVDDFGTLVCVPESHAALDA